MVGQIAGPKRRRPTKASTATAVVAASKTTTPAPPPPPFLINKSIINPPPPPPPPLLQSLTASSSNVQLTSELQKIQPNMQKREMVINKLAAQRNSGIPLDRDALLLSIRKGVNLRKIETKDKSGLFVDKDLITDIKKQPDAPSPCTE